MKITFMILAHSNIQLLESTINRIISNGHQACVHYDSSSSKDDLQFLNSTFKNKPENVCIFSTVQGAWGEWSLVDATLQGLNKIKELNWRPDYVHLMSGVDMFIRPLQELEMFLEKESADIIESVDISKQSWVVGGLEIERFIYEFPLNHVTQRAEFDQHLEMCIKNRNEVAIPKEIKPHMGSQWWTLRWGTCLKVLDFIKNNNHIVDYFKLCWIPDESFFQTVIRSVIPDDEIVSSQILFHAFTANGRPYLFMNGHEPLIERLPHFLIRKVNPFSLELIQYLENRVNQPANTENIPTSSDLISNKALFDYRIKSLTTLKKETPWSYLAIDDKNLFGKKILILIHDRFLDIRELAKNIKRIKGVHYLGRPYTKDHTKLPFFLLRNSQLLEANLSSKNPLNDPESWEVFQATNPEPSLFVISYVPDEDWINQHDEVLNRVKYGAVKIKSESIIAEAFLNNKLKHEHFVDLQEIHSVNFSNLEQEINSYLNHCSL